MPEPEPQTKRAMVLPIRRCVDVQKIVMQVPPDDSQEDDMEDCISLCDMDIDDDRSSNNIHNSSIDKDKNTQFRVTLNGNHANAFLAKKLLTEGLLNEDDELKTTEQDKSKPPENKEPAPKEKPGEKEKEVLIGPSQKKSPSNTSDESDTQAITKKEKEIDNEKREKILKEKRKNPEGLKVNMPVAKKRRASPIVFDVDKSKKRKEKEPIEKQTESVSSDQHVTVTSVTNTHKYDSVPPLSAVERKRKLVWCRAFPLCRNGNACAFAHPRCKFAATCTRRNCVYLHAPNALATPTTPTSPVIVSTAERKLVWCRAFPLCRYNNACAFAHPRCKFGAACTRDDCVYSHSPNAPAPPTTPTSPAIVSAAERKLVWCRAFPLCRYNNACAFAHPRCKFGAACTRDDCVYSHSPNAPAPPTTPTSPAIASHVVPGATNYKTISTEVPMCKFYPNCLNRACHYYHQAFLIKK